MRAAARSGTTQKITGSTVWMRVRRTASVLRGSLARVGGGRLDLLGVRLGLRVAAGLALVGGPVLAGLAGGGAGAAGQQRDGEGGRQQGGGERAKAWHGVNLLGVPRARARGGSWC